ncbi:MAG: ABC transporter permease [Thermoanaerobaculaceae bacterium]|nr:ABC transporter permease [Thermoanaerobaculaceae bacterium]
MVRWREVKLLYLRELRAALREKMIVTNSIVLPIVLYPFILWAMFTGVMFVQGQTEGFVSRVVIEGLPAAHAALGRQIERDDRFEVRKVSPTRAEAERQIREGDLDALVVFAPAPDDGRALPDNFAVTIVCDGAKERSTGARDRVKGMIAKHREAWLKRESARLGATPADWQAFTIQERNVASGRQMGSFLMSMMLPLFFVVMVAMGCFYPAVDATAGERERNTWETLMSLAASRGSIVAAKYLYVATMGCVAGLLNLVAMALSMKPMLSPLLARAGESFDFSVSPGAALVGVLAALLLAGFVAAGMMIFASFARTFKDGQSMITPFYLIVLMPILLVNGQGVKLTWPLAFLPVANISLMMREALTGSFPWPQMAVTVAVSILLILASLRLATAILRFEDVVIGSYGGSLQKLIRDRLLRRSPGGAEVRA